MKQTFLTLKYSPSKNYLFVNWNRAVSSSEYRQGIRSIATCVVSLKVQLILLDFSKIGTPSEQDQLCTANFLKLAMKNTSLKRSARVLSFEESQWLAYWQIVWQAKELPYETGAFKTREEAQAWLFDGQEINADAPDNFISVPLDISITAATRMFSNVAACEEGKETGNGNGVTIDVKDQKKSVQELYKTNYVSISLSKKKDILTTKWLRQVTSSEYRQGIEETGRHMLAHNIEKLMVNNQKLGILTMSDQNWLQKFSIEVISTSNLKRLAIVSSHDMLQQLTDETLDHKVKQADIDFHTRYFLFEDEGWEWLLLPEQATELKQ
ncbi:hypothetical protein ACSX1A_05830 [Pontibacter sp. MBLB2868]|uniref:hypothetical protein n=1 Tax=Pontibacter sp. MBLB2868 TaxID=3451555 RepID=UPI003F755241